MADIVIIAKILIGFKVTDNMKKMFLIIAATFFVVFCANAQYFQVDTARLNTAYRELVDNPDSDEKQ